MFLGAHFSNGTEDWDFCKNICGLADFAENLARVDGFAGPIHLPLKVIKISFSSVNLLTCPLSIDLTCLMEIVCT